MVGAGNLGKGRHEQWYVDSDAAMIKLTSSQDFISITTSYGSRDGTRRAR